MIEFKNDGQGVDEEQCLDSSCSLFPADFCEVFENEQLTDTCWNVTERGTTMVLGWARSCIPVGPII